MEMTWKEWKAMKKQLRRRLGMPGWTLLIYYGMMNVSVFLWTLVQTVMQGWSRLLSGDFAAIADVFYQAAERAGGIFLPLFWV